MLLKKLSEASGVSSNENEIRDIIKNNIKDNVDEFWTDIMGNLIAIKGKDKSNKKVLLSAHMDEIGLMITGIENNGLLKFRPVGNIDKRVLVSKTVLVGNKKIKGVIGSKAIHLQKSSERKKAIPWSNLYIDIGATSKEEAKKIIDLGDYAIFNTSYQQLGINHAKGKAFNGRIGCTALIEILKNSFDFTLYAVFSVQKEVGLRGAARAAHNINPDLAIVLDCTSASDVSESEKYDYSVSIDSGPAFTVIDNSVISDKTILNNLINTANEAKIPYQIKGSSDGSSDAGEINLTKEGIPTAVISIPCRYINTPVSLISLKDYENYRNLLKKYLLNLTKEEL